MIDDITFYGVQYFEIEIDQLDIMYPISIIFGSDNSLDIIQTERIMIF